MDGLFFFLLSSQAHNTFYLDETCISPFRLFSRYFVSFLHISSMDL